MMIGENNVALLQGVASALGVLKDKVVFVGGVTANLYSTIRNSPEPRVTIDVDCIIEVAPRSSFPELEEDMRALGFRNDIESGIICRWKYGHYIIDVMPIDSEVLGFSNSWYSEGFAKSVEHTLPDGTVIRILLPVYYLATKLEALQNRGMRDIKISKDLEDIVHITDNRIELQEEIIMAANDVKKYIHNQLFMLLAHPDIIEAIEWMLPQGSGNERKYIIERRLKEMLVAAM